MRPVTPDKRGLASARGSSMVLLLLFVAALSAMLLLTLPPLLIERRSVERDHLRLVAREMLDSGTELAAAHQQAQPGWTVSDGALLETPAITAGYGLAVEPHPRGTLARVNAVVFHRAGEELCTQSRAVVITPMSHPTTSRPGRVLASSDGPFTCQRLSAEP